MADEKVIKGRLYNLGNDYPSDVGRRPLAENTWVSDSYLDGIYTSAATDYITGGWNKYFNAVLPQKDWSDVEASAVFPIEYATTSAQEESAYKEAVTAYVSNGIDEISSTKFDGLDNWKK